MSEPCEKESCLVDRAILAVELSKLQCELSAREAELADARRMNEHFVRALNRGWCTGCTYPVEHAAFVTALLAAHDAQADVLGGLRMNRRMADRPKGLEGRDD